MSAAFPLAFFNSPWGWIAILFIAFDLEIAFVFPWAVIFRDLGMVGLVEMGIFLGLLVLGFVYVWKKGALEWE